LLSYSNFIPWL